jgi:hypothetical protein
MKLLAIKKIVNKLKEKIFAKQIEILLDNLWLFLTKKTENLSKCIFNKICVICCNTTHV